MKQKLHTLALAALTTISAWALNPPRFFIIDQEKALGGISYPTSLSWNEDYDTETTEIRVPETYTDADGVVYTVIAMEGGFPFHKNLQKVYVPKTIKHVGLSYNDVMNWQYFLEYVTEIEIDPANEYFTQENNIVFSKDKTTLFGAPLKNNPTTSIEIPEGVKYISNSAFKGLHITSVSLPNSVVAIGHSAFQYCNLTEVTLPENLKYIGNSAFTSPLKSGSYTELEYRIEIKNIPSTLIYDDLRWGATAMPPVVCYDEEIYINPGHIHTSYISPNPDIFPNLKSVRKDGMNGNTMATALVNLAELYIAKGLESPTIYTNDSIIAQCKQVIKQAEEIGYPYSAVPEMVSTGPMTPLIPGTEPENIHNLDDIIITIDKTNLWIRGGLTTPLALTPKYLSTGKINTDETDFYYPAIKLVESPENPGKYYILCGQDNIYMGEMSPWNPQPAALNDCRLITFHDANPALFTITDNGDGSYSITDSEGYPLCPGYDSYNILRGKSDFDRYNSNIALKSELSTVMFEATTLCETEGVFPYLVGAPEQLRSEHSEPREGSFANLFDDNEQTFWHSIWSSASNAPRHDLDMIFADGQTARNIIVDYRQRPYTGSKLGNARFHWSTDGGETFSEDFIEFDSTNGLNDNAGQLQLELDVDANALRLSGVGKNAVYWAMGELRVRDIDAKPIIEYSEEGRLELAQALAEVDVYPATGNFAESIAKLRALMESIKNGTYGGIETTMTESSEQAVEWYNLQGRRISHPTPGQIYIRRSGNHTTQKIKL